MDLVTITFRLCSLVPRPPCTRPQRSQQVAKKNMPKTKGGGWGASGGDWTETGTFVRKPPTGWLHRDADLTDGAYVRYRLAVSLFFTFDLLFFVHENHTKALSCVNSIQIVSVYMYAINIILCL